MAVRILAALVVAFWACLWPAGAAAGPPEFRGIPFGAALADLPDMERVAAFGQTVFCRRQGEKPLLGEACATDVRYGFSRGRLFFVRLTLSGPGCQGLEPLIRAFAAKYGAPVREGAPGYLRLVWRRPLLTVSLSHFARDGDTQVDYVYLPELSAEEREVWQSPEDIRARGPIGFRGIRFGRELSDIPGMTVAYLEGAAVYCRRTGDGLDLGATRLSDVLYGFYQGRFFAALMRAENAADFESLRQAYQAKYGPPRAIPATLEEEFVWSWPASQIALSRDAAGESLVIRYADAGLLAQATAAEAAAGAPPALSGGLRIFSRGDPPRSFRGVAFGSAETLLPNGEYLYTHRGRRYYRRADERLSLGDIVLSGVTYAYDGGRLAGVTLAVAAGEEPAAQQDRVLAAYAAKYGPPAVRQGEDGAVISVWSWPGLSIACVRPRTGPMEVHYLDASLLRRREATLARKALDQLDQKIFGGPDVPAARIENPNGQE